MTDEKPRSIKTIGIIIVVFSGFAIFSNGMGALMSAMLGFGETPPDQSDPSPITFVFAHYLEMCMTIVVIGASFLFGGLFVQKYKLWANRLVTSLSVVFVVIVWATMLIIRSSLMEEPGLEMVGIWTIVVAVFWTIPFGLLIWFLNRRSIVKYFD